MRHASKTPDPPAEDPVTLDPESVRALSEQVIRLQRAFGLDAPADRQHAVDQRRRRGVGRLRAALPAGQQRAAAQLGARRGRLRGPLDGEPAGRPAGQGRPGRAPVRPRGRPGQPAGRHRARDAPPTRPSRSTAPDLRPRPRRLAAAGRGHPRPAPGPVQRQLRRAARLAARPHCSTTTSRRTHEHHLRPAGCRARGVGRADPPADPDDPVRADGGHVPRRARPDDRRDVDPHHRRRPARPVSCRRG